MDQGKLAKPNAQLPIDRIPFTVTCRPSLPSTGGFLQKLHPLLQLSERCKLALPNVSMMAFRRPKNLQDYISFSF